MLVGDLHNSKANLDCPMRDAGKKNEGGGQNEENLSYNGPDPNEMTDFAEENLVVGGTNPTEKNGVCMAGQAHTAGETGKKMFIWLLLYFCRVGRGVKRKYPATDICL